MTETIPGPQGLPFLGNLLDLSNEEAPLRGLEQLAEIYGPIFQITIGGQKTVFCSSVELCEELCDGRRFVKLPSAALKPGGNSPAGLFQAGNEDPDWAQAHRILMPAFGPLSIEGMFDEMHDIATQLVMKWARQGSEKRISATDDFTRLTLDTIALCSMDFRFNSFYQENMHPFVEAMVGVLSEAQNRARRPAIITKFMSGTNAMFQENLKIQREIAMDLVQRRRQNPSKKNDLLAAMVNGKDPKTGQGMRDELITANMITFLIAGMYDEKFFPGDGMTDRTRPRDYFRAFVVCFSFPYTKSTCL